MLKIEIRESGGISGGRRRLIVENKEIRFVLIDRNGNENIKHASNLTDEEVNRLANLAKKLFSDSIRPRYGGYSPVSDAVSTNVFLELDGQQKSIETITDPKDPEPQELRDLINTYWEIVWKRTKI